MESLIVTVGSNPLPVALGILALQPSQVHYVYTGQVPEVVRRVDGFVRARLRASRASDLQPGAEIEVKDAFSASDIRCRLEASKSVLADAGLYYSGGTKSMVVHTHTWWMANGGSADRAAYLGPDGWLRFDDGPKVIDLRFEPRLSLEELIALHFGQPVVCGDHHRVPESLERARASVGTWLSSNEGPKEGTQTDLEIWLADTLAGYGVFDSVHQNVRVGPARSEPLLEADVVALKGHRAFVLSCTVKSAARKFDEVRLKLFEAIDRAGLIGGDLARAAVVSLHPDPKGVLQTVCERHWEGYDTVRAFGRGHLAGEKLPCRCPVGKAQAPPMTLEQAVRDWVGI